MLSQIEARDLWHKCVKKKLSICKEQFPLKMKKKAVKI